mgnify:CR=1 FL=1
MPYFYYLRYLITLRLDNNEIKERMSELGFEVTDKEIKKLGKGMMLPKIFEKYAEGENVDKEYLIKYAKKFNIKEPWQYKLKHKPKAIKEMYHLIKDKNARLIPVILTIKGDKGVHRSMRKLGFEYSKEAIELMLYYFFNMKKMDITNWKEFFEENVPKVAELLDKPLNYIRYKLGLNPKLEYDTILEDIMHLTYFKSREHLDQDTKEDIQMAKKLADLAIKAGEKLEKYGGGDSDTFLDDVHLQFENAGIELKGVEEIDEEHFDDEGQLDLI